MREFFNIAERRAKILSYVTVHRVLCAHTEKNQAFPACVYVYFHGGGQSE